MNARPRNTFVYLILSLLVCLLCTGSATAQQTANSGIPLNPYGIRTINPYVVDRFIWHGQQVDKVIVPSRPPSNIKAKVVSLPEPNIQAGTNTLANVPALEWAFGCSATSAAMMFGYYDRTGWSNMYAGPTNGGVFPLTNAPWPHVTINGEDRAQCPLSATRNGLDGRAIRGHVDDYWVQYGHPGPDPFIGNWTEHTKGECTGDYMGTNQSLLGNSDGSTVFFYYPSGAPLEDFTGLEPSQRDGCHGTKLFVESRGYSVVTNFTQLIYGYNGNTQGFTFANYKSEIDAGRPVLIHVEGHTMLGIGYNDSGSLVYLHDTWDNASHQMTWGGSYEGMGHWGMTVVRLVAAPPTITLNQALDNAQLNFSNSGNANWFGESTTSYYGGSAAQSGSITHNQYSQVQTTVTGPGTLSFYWRVSSQSGSDFLDLYIDAANPHRISGEVDWTRIAVSIPAGTHTITWKYSKDGSVSSGSDCGWVDKVVYTRGGITSVLPLLLD